MTRKKNRNNNERPESFKDYENGIDASVEEVVVETITEEEEQNHNNERKVKTINPSELVEKHNILESSHHPSHPERIEKILNKKRRVKVSSAECLMKERVNRILENLDRQQK